MPPKRSPQKYVRPRERGRDKGIRGKRTMFEVFIVLLGRVLDRRGRSNVMTRYQPCKYIPTRSPKKWTYGRKSGNILHVGSESLRGFPVHLLKDFATGVGLRTMPKGVDEPPDPTAVAEQTMEVGLRTRAKAMDEPPNPTVCVSAPWSNPGSECLCSV